jgi:predicted nuclease of predicted toxin-antitoxin system
MPRRKAHVEKRSHAVVGGYNGNVKLLLDHCVPNEIAELLRRAGYDVVRVVDIADPRARDREVAEMAARLGAVLITADSDFLRRTDFPPRRYCGIVVLRDLHRASDRVWRRLLRLLADRDLRGVMAVIDGRSSRVKV